MGPISVVKVPSPPVSGRPLNTCGRHLNISTRYFLLTCRRKEYSTLLLPNSYRTLPLQIRALVDFVDGGASTQPCSQTSAENYGSQNSAHSNLLAGMQIDWRNEGNPAVSGVDFARLQRRPRRTGRNFPAEIRWQISIRKWPILDMGNAYVVRTKDFRTPIQNTIHECRAEAVCRLKFCSRHLVEIGIRSGLAEGHGRR